MPWSNQGGGNKGPWGQGSNGSGGDGDNRNHGQQPPDLEELFKQGQDKLKNVFGGGGRFGGSSGSSGSSGGASDKLIFAVVLVGLLVIWGFNSFYQVQANEEGVVLRFGKYSRTTGPGPHIAIWPIETVETPQVLQEQKLDFGGVNNESQMLAGDQNIVDIRFTVLWRIKDAKNYLFNIRDQKRLVSVVAESAMREVVGRTNADIIRTRGRFDAQQQVSELIQTTLDRYKAGILIKGVQMEKADPPPQVIDAFEEVQRAEQNQNKYIREAEKYRNNKLGKARGESSKIVEDAKAYKARIVAEAEGEAQRFKEVYAEYSKAKEVTRKRLYLETMENILSKSNKIIIEKGVGGSGVVPYLPLTELQKKKAPTTMEGN